jgi:hypothetical protein
VKHHYASAEPFFTHLFEPTDDEDMPELLVRLAEHLTNNPDEMLLGAWVIPGRDYNYLQAVISAVPVTPSEA